ncbi:MAG: hypothetical protein NVS1B11_37940 [Terriglobales bacterium]
MNHSIYSADRSTHLKVVVIGLVTAITVAGLGMTAKINNPHVQQTAYVLKAGKPIVTSSNTASIR